MAVAKREVFSRMLNTDRHPLIPNGWDLGTHRQHGILTWGPSHNDAELVQHNLQRSTLVLGNLILRTFNYRRFLNAKMLDYFIDDSRLYPEEWKAEADGGPKFITYFGTLYLQPHDRPWVRYSFWDDDTESVQWGVVDLSEKWHSKRTYAAVLKQLSREREGAVG